MSVGGGFNSLFIPPRRSASPCTRGTGWRSQIEIGAAPVRKGRQERCDRGAWRYYWWGLLAQPARRNLRRPATGKVHERRDPGDLQSNGSSWQPRAGSQLGYFFFFFFFFRTSKVGDEDFAVISWRSESESNCGIATCRLCHGKLSMKQRGWAASIHILYPSRFWNVMLFFASYETMHFWLFSKNDCDRIIWTQLTKGLVWASGSF